MAPGTQSPLPRIEPARHECRTFERAVTREWLVTNGLGGFAAGTVSEVNTRRYHGLLIAALAPPVGRTLLVAKVDISVRRGGAAHTLFSNEFADGTVTPHGYSSLVSFALEGGVPVWRYAAGDAVIEKRITMAPGRNTTYLDVRVIRGAGICDIDLMPLCTYRDYHDHRRGDWRPGIELIEHGFEIDAGGDAPPYRVRCPGAVFTPDLLWQRGFRHRVETERGLDDTEDLFRPGVFTLRLGEGQSATVEISAEPAAADDARRARDRSERRGTAPIEALAPAAPGWIRQLALAADQFIVQRRLNGATMGKTVIAGYPWFTDWGRDTMIALPGLTLVTGRFEAAAAILRTYAGHLDQGMLPNRFPDDGERPEYNTVDATLWYFYALDQYTRRSGDRSLAAELYPVLQDIIAWHRRGTRYGIRVDPRDGLLSAGEPGVQLTWMDAKAGDWVVTPRIGKPVEVNALWYNALVLMAGWAGDLGDGAGAADYRDAAARAGAGYQRFWNARRGCLYDVIDGPEGEPAADGLRHDGRLRPNQLLAVSLPFSPLDTPQQAAVVRACEQALLTPFGLRSLAPGEPGYVPRYLGDRVSRDGAYHQGTVWAWLMGPFVDAHLRVHGDPARALEFLTPFRRHLDGGGPRHRQ